ncbi:MAG: hypothetical protein E7355_03310 [Clostridiales bacterium]|nr:hypothetical protein [Clostridiales bacterium]
MFDYTKAAVQKIGDDFKRLVYVCNIGMQLAYIAYLLYAIFAPTGIPWVNIALASIAVGYFVFFMIMTGGRALYTRKKAHKIAAKIFKYSKMLLKLFTIGVMVYGIYATTQNTTAFGVILSALMIVGWLLQLIFEIISAILVPRIQLLAAALEADKEELIKPAKAVGNFFKKMAGKDVEPEKEKTKSRLWLDKKVEETRAQRKEEKRQEKAAKKQAKRDAKNTVFLPKTDTPLILPDNTQGEEVFEEPPLLTGDTPLTKKEKKAAKKAAKLAKKNP